MQKRRTYENSKQMDIYTAGHRNAAVLVRDNGIRGGRLAYVYSG